LKKVQTKMVGQWKITGLMILSSTGKSFRIYQLTQDNKRVFIGLISRKTVSELLRGEIGLGEICQYIDKPQAQPAAQEALGFVVRAADPARLGAASHE
jgi:hypothetical protein